jgi:hypothetical protein
VETSNDDVGRKQPSCRFDLRLKWSDISVSPMWALLVSDASDNGPNLAAADEMLL